MKTLTNWRRTVNTRSQDADRGDEETGCLVGQPLPSRLTVKSKTQGGSRSSIRVRQSTGNENENIGPEGAGHVRISVSSPPPPTRSSWRPMVGEESMPMESYETPTAKDPLRRCAKVKHVSTDKGQPLLAQPRLNSRRATAMHTRVEASSLQRMSTNSMRHAFTSMEDSSSVLDGSGDDDIQQSSVFGSFFDLTTERLSHIFGQFVRDETGRVSYEALRQGLLHWAGIHVDDDEQFNKLIHILDEDYSHDISFSEFEGGVRLLMMQQLFSDNPDPETETSRELDLLMPPLVIVDYNALSVRRTKIATSAHMHEFMFSKREGWVQSRWIDAYGTECMAVTLKRLAVKYRLHPLALEAAISPSQRPKVDKYSTHYCIIAPLFSCERVFDQDEAAHRRKIGSSRVLTVGDRMFCGCCRRGHTNQKKASARCHGHLRVKIENVCMFICGSPTEDDMINCDTLITFQREQPKEDPWERVLRELGKSYAKLRQYDVQYLSYVILDTVVDRLLPVAQAFRSALDDERETLVNEGVLDLALLYLHKDQLQQILRSTRLLGRMLTHIIEDDEICEGVTLYLREVRDSTEGIEDDIRTLITSCENLEAEFEKFRSSQAERTLYRLSVISSIFLPAQFLTGVFGMNFDNMPELHWTYSYYGFWVVTIAIMIPALLYFGCGNLN